MGEVALVERECGGVLARAYQEAVVVEWGILWDVGADIGVVSGCAMDIGQCSRVSLCLSASLLSSCDEANEDQRSYEAYSS